MTGYDDDGLSTDTVLRAIFNNGELTGAGTRRHPRRMQLLDRMPFADAIRHQQRRLHRPRLRMGMPHHLQRRRRPIPQPRYPAIARMIQQDFKRLARDGELHFPNWRHLGGQRGRITFTYPPMEAIVAVLSGRDLVCTCPLDEACHGDVLLRLANPDNPCPECAQGKHRNCTEITLDDNDEWTLCNCHDTTHPTPTATALAAARQEAANRP